MHSTECIFYDILSHMLTCKYIQINKPMYHLLADVIVVNDYYYTIK